MKIRLLKLFLIFSLFSTGGIAGRLQAQSELSQYPEDVRQLSYFVDHVVEELGYAGVNLIGFDKGKNMALTTIYITSKEYDFVRTAEVSEDGSGASVGFRTYRSCTVTSQAVEKRISVRIITVDGQKIQAAYMCAKTPDDSSKTQEIFVIKTAKGREFIHNHFLNQQFVFVRLGDDFEVPFSTKGFPELWDRVSRPAL